MTETDRGIVLTFIFYFNGIDYVHLSMHPTLSYNNFQKFINR